MNAIAGKQLGLPILGQDARLIERCGNEPVDVKVGGTKLEGGYLVRPVAPASLASPEARAAFLKTFDKADAILIRGRDGSAYVVEGQRLIAGKERPSVGQQVTFNALKEGTPIAGEYTIEAFYRGSGGLRSWDISSKADHANGTAAKVAIPPELNIYDDGKLGDFSIYAFAASAITGVAGIAELIAGGVCLAASAGIDAALGTGIVDTLTGPTAATIADYAFMGQMAIIGACAAAWMGGTMLLATKYKVRQINRHFANKALDAQDVRDNGAGVRTQPNRAQATAEA